MEDAVVYRLYPIIPAGTAIEAAMNNARIAKPSLGLLYSG